MTIDEMNKILRIELNKTCIELQFSEEKIREFELEITRRNVSRSFSGMPLNLIFSLAKKDIEYIRDYKKLD